MPRSTRWTGRPPPMRSRWPAGTERWRRPAHPGSAGSRPAPLPGGPRRRSCRLGRSTPATADRSRCACSVHRATGGPGTMAFTRSSRGAHDPSRRAHAVPTMLWARSYPSSEYCPEIHRMPSSSVDLRAPSCSGSVRVLRPERCQCFRRSARLRRVMRVIIMGCGRVGSELSEELADGGHDVVIIDKDPEAFFRYPPAEGTTTVVGLGFDRDVLREAGIEQADAFVAVSSGDNSNIVSARVALERFHVPKVVARIYDPRRAEIYERLNIPTVATTAWGIKQIQLMLFHDRKEIRESLGGGDLLRMRVPVPQHLVGRSPSSLNVEGKVLVAGVSRGGGGFLPTDDSTMQSGDFLVLISRRTAWRRWTRCSKLRAGITHEGDRDRRWRRGTASRGRPRGARPRCDADRAEPRVGRQAAVVGRGREHRVRRRLRAVGARGGADGAGRGRRGGHRRRRGQPGDLAARQAGVRGPARPGPREPPQERVALQRTVGRRCRGLSAAHPHRHGGGSRHRGRPGSVDPVGRRRHLDRGDDPAGRFELGRARRSTSCGCPPTPPSSGSCGRATS